MVTAMIGSKRNGGELRLAVLLRMNMHRYDPALIARIMGLLHPELDPSSDAVELIDTPAQRLIEVDAVVAAWPRDFSTFGELTPERQAGLAVVSDQMSQLRRTLAEAGLAPAQLEQLGDGADDPMLARELSLLAKEAAWQLRTLARQARRRWRAGAQGSYPADLQTWMDRCDNLAHDLLGEATGDQDD
jgi:hypothetical protein